MLENRMTENFSPYDFVCIYALPGSRMREQMTADEASLGKEGSLYAGKVKRLNKRKRKRLTTKKEREKRGGQQ